MKSLALALLVVSGFAHAQSVMGIEAATLKANDAFFNDDFGFQVSLSGTRALVGAGNADPGGLSDAGAAYVYELQPDGSWTQAAKLTAFDAAAGDYFGGSVSISGDRAIVGAPNNDAAPGFYPGSAYLFERQSNGSWIFITKLLAPGPVGARGFGWSLCLDGDRAIVGAPQDDTGAALGAGAAYVFERQGDGSWPATTKLRAADGDIADDFGHSVALSGSRAVVGAPFDNLGGALNGGSAYVFEREGDGKWGAVVKLTVPDAATNDYFGYSVSVSGDRVLAGAFGTTLPSVGSEAGAAYVFERQGDGTWTQAAKLVSSDPTDSDQAGISVGISGDRAVLGVPRDDVSPGEETGAVLVFDRQGDGSWIQVAKLVASDEVSFDSLGNAAAVSGDLVLAGAPEDDHTGTARVFRLCNACLVPYGTGTPGCSGPHSIAANLPPSSGMAAFELKCDNAPPASLGLGLVADAADVPGSDLFGLGVLLHVDLASATQVLAFDFVSDPSGRATMTAPIPAAPALVGRTFFASALWAWTGCSLPPYDLSSSNGLSITILAP